MIFDGGRLAKRGQTSEVWNAAVIGPSFLLPGGSRTGDKLTFSAVGMFTDGQPGRSGSDTAATGTATLAKNGKVLAAADLADCVVYQPRGCELRADLPAGSGGYTMTASMRRQATLSTQVNTAWTFLSATTAKEQPLPLMAVRYSPEGLDDSNRAKPGSTTRIPVWVERNPAPRRRGRNRSGWRCPPTTAPPGVASRSPAPAPAGPPCWRTPVRPDSSPCARWSPTPPVTG